MSDRGSGPSAPRWSWARSVLVPVALASVVLMPGAASGAGGAEPPALPEPSGDRCVPASPMVALTVSAGYARVAPGTVRRLTDGAGVTVAVLDTGVSSRASGLGGAVAAGRDVISGRRADNDCFGRGTALAALIAARPVDGSALVGVAPAARILPIRVVDVGATVPPGALAKGIQAAADRGADVILIGAGAPPGAQLRTAVAEAAARDVLVVAAVNGETEPVGDARTEPWYPASDPAVLAVGGLDRSGAPIGDTSERSGLDLVAPAAGVFGVGPSGPGNYQIGGTPVAAAYVAGAAALVRAHRPELSVAQVRERLVASAMPGRELDVYSAVTGVDPHPAVPTTAAAAPLPVLARAAGPPAATFLSLLVAGASLGVFVAGYLVLISVRRAWAGRTSGDRSGPEREERT